MPNYDEPVSDDTPCLELPATRREKRWLWMHEDCEIQMVMVEGEVLIEDLTCNVFLIGTTKSTSKLSAKLKRLE